MRPAHYQTRPRTELTERQEEVLRLIARGYTNAQIGEALGITLDGAKAHVREVMRKLDASSREDAVEIWRSREERLRWTAKVLLPLKVGWALAGAVVAAVVVAAVVVTFILLGDDDDAPAPVDGTVTSTATSTPTVTATGTPATATPHPEATVELTTDILDTEITVAIYAEDEAPAAGAACVDIIESMVPEHGMDVVAWKPAPCTFDLRTWNRLRFKEREGVWFMETVTVVFPLAARPRDGVLPDETCEEWAELLFDAQPMPQEPWLIGGCAIHPPLRGAEPPRRQVWGVVTAQAIEDPEPNTPCWTFAPIYSGSGEDRVRIALCVLHEDPVGFDMPEEPPLELTRTMIGTEARVAIYSDEEAPPASTACIGLVEAMVPEHGMDEVEWTTATCTIDARTWARVQFKERDGVWFLSTVAITFPLPARPGVNTTFGYEMCRDWAHLLIETPDNPFFDRPSTEESRTSGACQIEPPLRGDEPEGREIWARAPWVSGGVAPGSGSPCWTLVPTYGAPGEGTGGYVRCFMYE